MKRLITISAVFAAAVACSDVRASSTGLIASGSGSASTLRDTAVSPANGSSAAPASRVEDDAAYREVALPAGTVLPVDLLTAVGSDISRVEQPVQGRLRRAVTINGVEVLPAGTAISGHVTAARRPGKVKGRGYVALRFTQLDTPGAGTTRIATNTIARLAPATKQKDAVKILAPAAAGAVIGRVAGGKGTAGKGAVIGGAAGTGYVLATRGQEARIGKGADLSVKLTAPVTVHVR